MDVDALINRPRLYAFEDGTTELMVGLSSLGLAGAFARFPPRGPGDMSAGMLWLAVVACVVLGARTVKAFSTRRGGYVALDRPNRTNYLGISPRKLNAVAGLVIAAFLVESLTRMHLTSFDATIACGVLMVTYAFEGVSDGIPDMLWMAAFSALLGVWTFIAQRSLLFAIGGEGAGLVFLGAIKLQRFVATHPASVATQS